jgi:hypothetical protein
MRVEPSRSFPIAAIGNRNSDSQSVSTNCAGIESGFKGLKDFGRIATRSDKPARNYLASVPRSRARFVD